MSLYINKLRFDVLIYFYVHMSLDDSLLPDGKHEEISRVVVTIPLIPLDRKIKRQTVVLCGVGRNSKFHGIIYFQTSV